MIRKATIVLGGAALCAALVIAGVVSLVVRASQDRDAQVKLVETANAVEPLQGLPWLTAEGGSPAAAHAVLLARERSIESRVAMLQGRIGSQALVGLRAPLERNFAALDGIFRYAVSGRKSAARASQGREVAERTLAPVVARLSDAADYARANAARSRNEAVGGSVAGILLLLGAFAVFYRRSWRAQSLVAAIVESSEDAITAARLDGTVTAWNTGAERIYGYTASEAIGRHLSFVIPPSEEPLAENFARVAAGESIERMVTKRLHKNGHEIDIALTVSPIRDASGRVVGASAIARDTTAELRAEEAIRRSEEQHRVLWDANPYSMWVFDIETLRFPRGQRGGGRALRLYARRVPGDDHRRYPAPRRVAGDAGTDRGLRERPASPRTNLAARDEERRADRRRSHRSCLHLRRAQGTPGVRARRDRADSRRRCAAAARGGAARGAEARGDRPPCRRHRSRLQQLGPRNSRLCRAPARRIGRAARRTPQGGGDRDGGSARDRPHPAAARVQPPAGARADGGRRQRHRRRGDPTPRATARRAGHGSCQPRFRAAARADGCLAALSDRAQPGGEVAGRDARRRHAHDHDGDGGADGRRGGRGLRETRSLHPPDRP